MNYLFYLVLFPSGYHPLAAHFFPKTVLAKRMKHVDFQFLPTNFVCGDFNGQPISKFHMAFLLKHTNESFSKYCSVLSDYT